MLVLEQLHQHTRHTNGYGAKTADYRMGDILIFSVFTVHTSLDNGSNKIYLSTDTRYQRADEPIDERWIGAEPIMTAQVNAAKYADACYNDVVKM